MRKKTAPKKITAAKEIILLNEQLASARELTAHNQKIAASRTQSVLDQRRHNMLERNMFLAGLEHYRQKGSRTRVWAWVWFVLLMIDVINYFVHK